MRSLPKTTYVPTDEIIDLYVNHKLSSTEVGRRVGLTRQAVCFRLNGAGVEARPRTFSLKKPPVFTKEILQKLYVEDGLTVAQIAEKLDTTSEAITREMKHFGIERRKKGSWMSSILSCVN